MVAAIRSGVPQRQVARLFGVGLRTVQYWIARAEGKSLDEVGWSDRRRGPQRAANRTEAAMEARVLDVRQHLKDHSALGEYGAEAIRRGLLARGEQTVPSVRTIGRIVQRLGAVDRRRRVRRPAPPRGWYLPDVAVRAAELDAFDGVEGLAIEGGHRVEVLTGLSLHGGLPAAWPLPQITAKKVVQRLLEHWQQFGLPAYAQFDNATVFQGAHQYRDTVGRVTRLCLALQIVPVFTVPGEVGFQGALESFNGRWQTKVWSRFHHASRADLRQRSMDYIEAVRRRSAARIDAAPSRRPFPANWELDFDAPLEGRIIYLRRTDDEGRADLLGHRFSVDPQWPNRPVRSELDLDAGTLRFFALRRSDPAHQPLLKEILHRLPQRPFQG